MVPVSSLLLMALNGLLGIAIPVCLAWYLVRRHQASLSSILIGAGTFIVFALVLESILHQVVLKGPWGASIQGKTWLFALYGGLAAGIFEECGRWISMKYLMKKEPSKPLPGLAYGVGHGGAEMILIFGVTMIGNLVLSLLINSGQAETLFAQAPAEAGEQIRAQLTSLQTTSAGTWLLGLWERLSALVLQLALSLLVWTAVRRGGKCFWLFPAAILLHAGVDAGAVLLQKSLSLPALEAILTAEALGLAVIAIWLQGNS